MNLTFKIPSEFVPGNAIGCDVCDQVFYKYVFPIKKIKSFHTCFVSIDPRFPDPLTESFACPKCGELMLDAFGFKVLR